ncbi:MAG: CotG/ExsB N-terminal domain-containing protein [Ectobacillus sp.]
MKNYDKKQIRKAVNEIQAAGMGGFLKQEPYGHSSGHRSHKRYSKHSRRSKRSYWSKHSRRSKRSNWSNHSRRSKRSYWSKHSRRSKRSYVSKCSCYSGRSRCSKRSYISKFSCNSKRSRFSSYGKNRYSKRTCRKSCYDSKPARVRFINIFPKDINHTKHCYKKVEKVKDMAHDKNMADADYEAEKLNDTLHHERSFGSLRFPW